jgi:glycosyltransferase involved in cell wall biosynthesis
VSTDAPPETCLVTFADPDGSGGVPRMLRHLRDGLRARGHAVSILSRPLTRGVRQTLFRRAWRRLDASSEEVHRIRLALTDLEGAVESAAEGAVCVAFEAWTAAICARAGRRTIYRVAGLGSITDEWIRNGFVSARSRHVAWLRALEREGFEAAERVVVLAEAGRRAIAGLGADDDRVTLVPNGIAVGDSVDRSDRDGRVVTALCVANLRPVKGVDVLARAVAALPERRRAMVRLVHVGAGADPGNPGYARARAALEGSRVDHEFRGALPPDGVQAALREADVFVLPSRKEMFSNALLEAMAAGLPVIGTAVGATPEVLGMETAAAGLVVPPDDPEALTAALDRLIGDGELRRLRGSANRERVLARYTLDHTLDAYARLVRQVASI